MVLALTVDQDSRVRETSVSWASSASSLSFDFLRQTVPFVFDNYICYWFLLHLCWCGLDIHT